MVYKKRLRDSISLLSGCTNCETGNGSCCETVCEAQGKS